MKNKIEDLRNHLFSTIESLLDEEKPMAVDRARAIAEVGKVIVESAKVEVLFAQTTKGKGSDFMPAGTNFLTLPEPTRADRPPAEYSNKNHQKTLDQLRD